MMERREFLMQAAALTALTSGTQTRKTSAQAGDRRTKLDRVAIMSLCFNSILKTLDAPADSSRTLDLMDLPEMYADRYGVHNLELQHSHFHSTEPAYLRALLNRVQAARSRISQINTASWGSQLGPIINLSVPGWTRLHTIDLTKRWIDHAVALGCPRVMMNQGALAPDVRDGAIETLETIAEYGESRGVMVTLENNSRNWEVTAQVVKAAGTYTTPDLGNFPDQETQLKGIRALFPMNSGNAHVKLNPERYDLAKALALTQALGYDGLYSIEASRRVDPDPYAAVQKILDALMDHI